jgi:hypothetical protein
MVTLSAAVTREKARGETRVAFAEADAAIKDERFSNGAPVPGVLGGWRLASARLKEAQASTWILDHPLELAAADELVVTINGDDLGRIRVSTSPIAFEDPRKPSIERALIDSLASSRQGLAREPAIKLDRAWLTSGGADAATTAAIRGLRKERAECHDGRAWTMVTQAWPPPPVRLLKRGNFLDDSGEVVLPGVPDFLPQPRSKGPRLNRLDLANWLVAKENPLTARVFVNRLWRQVFGAGLSAVVDDLGAQGEWPSHPELLDWLAVEFRESGWDVKRMVRLLVTSAAYRQDSKARPELREVDPGDRLIAYMPPRRLEAEFVRDNALSIAGLLNPEVGGPSVHPYQPAGYYVNIQFPNRDYVADRDSRQYRRGIYTHWQRTFMHPMLANFDAPSREECTATRTVANTPQQALTLLNDPTFVEAARVTASRLLAEPGDDSQRIDRLYRRALGRGARPVELKTLLAFLDRRRAETRAAPEDARKLVAIGHAPVPAGQDVAELAAWLEVCRVVLNLHETITRY